MKTNQIKMQRVIITDYTDEVEVKGLKELRGQ